MEAEKPKFTRCTPTFSVTHEKQLSFTPSIEQPFLHLGTNTTEKLCEDSFPQSIIFVLYNDDDVLKLFFFSPPGFYGKKCCQASFCVNGIKIDTTLISQLLFKKLLFPGGRTVFLQLECVAKSRPDPFYRQMDIDSIVFPSCQERSAQDVGKNATDAMQKTAPNAITPTVSFFKNLNGELSCGVKFKLLMRMQVIADVFRAGRRTTFRFRVQPIRRALFALSAHVSIMEHDDWMNPQCNESNVLYVSLVFYTFFFLFSPLQFVPKAITASTARGMGCTD